MKHVFYDALSDDIWIADAAYAGFFKMHILYRPYTEHIVYLGEL